MMNTLMPFRKFEAEFLRLVHTNDLLGAVDWLRLGGGQYPEKAALLFFWRACMAALMEKPDEAIEILQQGIEFGYWWSESLLCGDDDLASLQNRSDFSALLPLCRERKQQAEASQPAEVLVYAPASDFPTPIMIVLHGWTGNAETSVEPFLHLPETGWLLAAIQSSQLTYPGGHCWDDRNRARQDILDMWDALNQNHLIDPSRIVVAGFSQGGGLAVEISLNQIIPARGVLAIAPYLQISDDLSNPGSSKQPLSGLRAYLMTGELDENQPTFKKIEEWLRSCQVPCHREQIIGMAHEFPADFPSQLDRALSFLQNGWLK